MNCSYVFFQKHWEIIKEDITVFIKDAFEKEYFTEHMNESLITLLPKQENLMSMAQLHPIVLCNVVSKAITKIITNQL